MKHCPNCDSLDTALSLPKYHKCQTCGVWFIPDITDDDLFTYYNSGAYRARNQQQDERAHQERRAAHILQYIETPRVFVDIGCSMGVLLDAVKDKYNCAAFGVDIDTVLARNVYASIKYVPCPADCVTMIHSLEHMPRPLEALKETHRHMTDGGRMIVEVPNAAAYKSAFQFPHVVMFDQDALHWTMAAAGFRIERSLIHGEGGLTKAPSDYYLLMIGTKLLLQS